MRDEFGADLRQPSQPHVNDERLIGLREVRPVEIDAIAGEIAGDEANRVRPIAMRQRNVRVARATERSGDSRHHFERDALLRQRFDLFAAAAENERVAALQPHDPIPGAGGVDQHLVDRLLTHRVKLTSLSDVHASRVASRHRNHVRRNQVVVKHDVRAFETLQRLQRQQSGIARSRPDQRNESRRLLIPTLQALLDQQIGQIDVAFVHRLRGRTVEHVVPEAPS